MGCRWAGRGLFGLGGLGRWNGGRKAEGLGVGLGAVVVDVMEGVAVAWVVEEDAKGLEEAALEAEDEAKEA